jgi:ELWxxDGT repeat protein
MSRRNSWGQAGLASFLLGCTGVLVLGCSDEAATPPKSAISSTQQALVPTFVMDTITTPKDATANSSPRGFLTIGSTTYFVASDDANGDALWRTDGTPAGTTLVKDMNPGPSSGNVRERRTVASSGCPTARSRAPCR